MLLSMHKIRDFSLCLRANCVDNVKKKVLIMFGILVILYCTFMN